MLIRCSLAGLLQATRIAAHALSTTRMELHWWGRNHVLFKHAVDIFKQTYRPPCTRRETTTWHLFRDTGGSCCSASQIDWAFFLLCSKSCSTYFATHLDFFIYSTLWHFEPWEVDLSLASWGLLCALYVGCFNRCGDRIVLVSWGLGFESFAPLMDSSTFHRVTTVPLHHKTLTRVGQLHGFSGHCNGR